MTEKSENTKFISNIPIPFNMFEISILYSCLQLSPFNLFEIRVNDMTICAADA